MKKEKPFYLSWDGALFSVFLILLISHYTGLTKNLIDALLLGIFSIVGTLPIIVSAYHSLKNKKISVDLLASIALIVSILNRQWGSAIFINLMLTSARIFGAYTEERARAAIKSLLKLRPQKAKIKQSSQIMEVPVSEVKIGDLVVIESGERIPFDGTVVEGEASIDQSSLTGESIPVHKTKGNQVLSATLNVSGSLVVKTEKIGKDTTLEKIIALVEESQKGKAQINSRADIFTTWYISLTFLGSIVIYLFTKDLNLLLTILLVTCADDIAVAVPMAFMAAIGYAGRRGVIIKGGLFLEGLAKLKVLILDKTGTITKGKLKIMNIVSFGKYKNKDLLIFGAMAEIFSNHPVAKEIMSYIDSHKIKYPKPKNFEEYPGRGTLADYKNKKIVSGNLNYLEEMKVKISKDELKEINKAQDQGYNLTFIAYDKKLVGFFVSADETRPNAKATINRLKDLGVEKLVMLTGDNEKVAERVAKEINIPVFHANLLPEDKLNYVKKYLGSDHKTAMVGDGVNDAASLALADIGIAMGAIGSDAAIEAADVALMRDDFSEIPEMVELGRYTMKIANQDFIIWGTVNIIGLILALGRFMGPEGAAAYNFITDFLPLMNSLRLFNLHRKLK